MADRPWMKGRSYEWSYERSQIGHRGETGCGKRRRRWTAEQKRQIVAESMAPGASAAMVARRHGDQPRAALRLAATTGAERRLRRRGRDTVAPGAWRGDAAAPCPGRPGSLAAGDRQPRDAGRTDAARSAGRRHHADGGVSAPVSEGPVMTTLRRRSHERCQRPDRRRGRTAVRPTGRGDAASAREHEACATPLPPGDQAGRAVASSRAATAPTRAAWCGRRRGAAARR